MSANAYSATHRTRRPHPSRAADIVTISDNPTLALYLSGLFQQFSWTIARRCTCAEGLSFLQEHNAAVAVCEETLPDGSWHGAAVALASVPNAPALIVISDDSLTVREVVARGGFDVLVRPLRESDVVWSVTSAWHAWMKRAEGGGSGGLRCSGA